MALKRMSTSERGASDAEVLAALRPEAVQDAPESSPDAEAPKSPDTRMKYNDRRLKEMLHMASACLRVERLPGEMRERDFFKTFEEQDAERQSACEAQIEPEPEKPIHAPVQPCPPTPDGLAPAAHAAKLRRDIRDLERLTNEGRQELELESIKQAKLALDRCHATEKLSAAKTELKKEMRGLRELKEMYRLQEKEIGELQKAVATAAEESVRAAEVERVRVAEHRKKTVMLKVVPCCANPAGFYLTGPPPDTALNLRPSAEDGFDSRASSKHPADKVLSDESESPAPVLPAKPAQAPPAPSPPSKKAETSVAAATATKTSAGVHPGGVNPKLYTPVRQLMRDINPDHYML